METREIRADVVFGVAEVVLTHRAGRVEFQLRTSCGLELLMAHGNCDQYCFVVRRSEYFLALDFGGSSSVVCEASSDLAEWCSAVPGVLMLDQREHGHGEI